MINKKNLSCMLFIISISFFSKGFAEVRLPAIIGDHMVLLQNKEVNLWGWSDPDEKINIKTTWDTTVYSTIGMNTAKWNLKIKTPAAGGPYKIFINGKNALVLDDVMIGEIWVCSGQSNMEWSGSQALKQSIDEAPHATNTKIRLFYVPKATSEYPQEYLNAHWVVCNPEDMKHFSAIGYFFGKKLQQELNVPIGLINSNWGGTPAEVWTPKEEVENTDSLKQAANKLSEAQWWPILPGYIYNAMIYPLTKYNISGAIWYQGESNTKTWSTYPLLFSKMINAWRKAWVNEIPFYYVQIAPYAGYGQNNIGALLRESQTKSMTTANTGMVVISDLVDDIHNIHPQNKMDVALRLANFALAETYGMQKLVYKSPFYKTMKVEKDKVRVYFENADNGLITKSGDPTEFYIAGEDQRFLPAKAKIDKNTVVVWNKDIKNPVAVRFGFSNDAIPNLFNKEGLPVNLFRTDDWPVDAETEK